MRKISKDECHNCGKSDEYLDDITCNKCGKTCKMFMTTDHKHFNYEGLRAKLSGGYGSRWDEQTLSFDLCEQCVVELIDTFQIPVEIFACGLWGEES